MPDKLPKIQLDIYRDYELPRLDSLIEVYAKEYGNFTKLVDAMNAELSSHGITGFGSVNDISALRRDEKNEAGIKTSAYSDRTIYRLAIGLKIDSDYAWAYAALRLYLLGLIDNVEPETINLIKQAARFQPESFLKLDIQQWVRQASDENLKEFAVLAIQKIGTPKEKPVENSNLINFIYGILARFNLPESHLFENSRLDRKTLADIKDERPISQDLTDSLAAWISDVSNELWTAAELIEAFNLKTKELA